MGGGDASCSEADEVLQRLGQLVAIVDPVPPALQAAAGQLLTWRTVDAELAALADVPAPATAD